ncbi:Pyridoxal biosynthesis protein PDX2 [Acorus calamus]|uniref:glutaminase n=1 Tax=Acorus calamus TaxID=4465 RepID=A0AAV9CM48_ACOCL|nr:Pyridoxal biosynthesis protein PDX2 [Acorus calamus]
MLIALRRVGVKGVEVRKSDELDQISALIIPGGESTTMSKLAHYHNLFPALRDFVKSGKPVWGTCAGLIFLADKAIGQKMGGQDLVGGLDCMVHRNYFGSQLQSFETELHVPKLAAKVGGPTSFRGVFIRAPAILEAGPGVEILADYPVSSDKSSTLLSSDGTQQEEAGSREKVIVAVKQGNLLATAFHPELTSDTRWHSFFLKMMEDNGVESSFGDSTTEEALHEQQKGRSNDLPAGSIHKNWKRVEYLIIRLAIFVYSVLCVMVASI